MATHALSLKDGHKYVDQCGSVSGLNTEFSSLLLCTLCHFTSVPSESTLSSRIWGSIRYSLFESVKWCYIVENTWEPSHMRTFLSSVTTVITIDIHKNAKANIETTSPIEGFCPFIYFQTFLSWWMPILLPWFQLVYFDLYQVRIKLNRQ